MKEFIGSLEVPVIVGGVADYTTALHLMRTGAVGVIVGAGVTTNAETVGIDTAMATAIADAAAARRDYLDETEGRYVHIIADADFDNSGTIAKAFACGADSVALGPLLAQAREAGGKGWYWPATAGHPRFPRGYAQFAGADTALDVDFLTASDAVPAVAPSLETVLHGPSSEPFGQTNLVGALRRALAKCGYTDLKSFQKVELAVRY